MIIGSTKKFNKQLVKFPIEIERKFIERLMIFKDNPYHPILKNHNLKGKFSNCKSINITSDIRAIYKEEGADLVIFIEIGTHSELYQ